MKLKIHFYRKRGQWRWQMTTMNDIIVGSSSEGFTQRIGCFKNFALVTGWKPPQKKDRAARYNYVLSAPKFCKRPYIEWSEVSA